ncbi:MAG: VCBS repeat-containing protein [Candidatus Kapabacteria bacterium]|nr:VCBS repeat-containing protein [Candidatus Kapabacteria bacterium]
MVLLVVACITLCASVGLRAQMFERMDPKRSGITFRNDIVESNTYNVLTDFYAYNGGGVGVGDLDSDGLLDVVFTSTSSGITHYRNKGGMRFEDVSSKSGLQILDTKINTGVLIADLTGDSFADVYICRRYEPNRLFVNNGNGTFTDRSIGSALSIAAFSTNAYAFDYDRDGDLDVFLVNSGEPRRQGYLNPGVSDQLFRNDGNGVFTDVTTIAGILDKGYGLSASIGDLNNDGWLDVFVTNDFEERDKVWINSGNGMFGDSTAKAMANMSWASMGSDIADLDGDGLLDVITLDMLPRDNYRRQTQLGGMSIYGPFFDSTQRVHNALQLNRGNGRFSNVCYMAGVAATDWSWCVLAGDFDLDGRQDLFITNGTKRDLGDQDYANNLFAKSDAAQTDAYKQMPKSKLSNYLFRNVGGFRFTDATAIDGVSDPEVSNGASMADLDNDGDLDIIVNNTDTTATVYMNRTIQSVDHSVNWVGISLRGGVANSTAIGARVTVYARGSTLVREVMAARGFLSTSDTRIQIGLSKQQVLDSVVVQWPTGFVSKHTKLAAKSYTTITMPLDAPAWVRPVKLPTIMGKLRKATIPFWHQENSYDDFKRERLLPYRFSKDGPGLAIGDVNGDGMVDVILTGPKYQATQCFLQKANETFEPFACGIDDVNESEDVDAALVDIDGDKDLDLVVVSGGSEFDEDDPELEDRLYRNNGKGQFKRIVGGLPGGNVSGSCVTVADYDLDGDADLFVGGRVVPGKFPNLARSIVYRNDRGSFKDVTDEVAPGLAQVGMTTRAIWADIDGDKDPDLIVVGEWITPRIWINTKGRFKDASNEWGMSGHEGWWSAIHAVDIDRDGDLDLIAGNVGLNCRFAPEPGKPLTCYVDDFDDNGSIDPIMTYVVNDTRVPTRGRLTLTQHMPSLTRKFNTYAQFAVAGIDDIIPVGRKDSSRVLVAREFASCLFINEKGRFTTQPLPDLAQISPITAIATRDLDADGDMDVIVAGNTKTADGDNIAFDAGIGLVMRNDGRGVLTPLSPVESGFSAPHEVRRMAILPIAGASDILCVAVNGRTPRLFHLPPAK